MCGKKLGSCGALPGEFLSTMIIGMVGTESPSSKLDLVGSGMTFLSGTEAISEPEPIVCIRMI